MTSPRTPETDTRTETALPAPKRPLSAVQVAASALGAVSAAVVASFFGVAGTLIGAALASVITTVSAALYGASLRRTTERLQRLRERATGDVRAAGMTGSPARGRATAPAPDALPAHLDPRRDPRRPPARTLPRPSRLALGAAAAFALAMMLITSVELIGQRPVSAMVGASSERSTTTVGELTGGGATPTGRPTPTPASPTGQTTAPTTGSATATPESRAPAPRSTAPAGTAATTGRTTAPRSSDAGAGPSAPAAATTAP
jgi:hypothetical protein